MTAFGQRHDATPLIEHRNKLLEDEQSVRVLKTYCLNLPIN